MLLFSVNVNADSKPNLERYTETISSNHSIQNACSKIDHSLLELTFEKDKAGKACVSGIENQEQVAGRGCCSWHGGVCGCSNGRALCCDGQLSPSCGC